MLKKTFYLSIISFITLWFLIAYLLFFLSSSKKRLALVASQLDSLSNEMIDYTVKVKLVIPVDSYIDIIDPMNGKVDMNLHKSISFNALIPIKQKVKIPLDLPLNQRISLNTKFLMPDSLNVKINSLIPLDQKVKVFLIGKKGLRMRIAGQIPLNEKMSASISDSISVSGSVPIAIRVQDSILVPLNLNIPIKLTVPVDLQIHDFFDVKILSKVHFKGNIPIEMAVPVKIPLAKTALYPHLQKTKFIIEHLLDF